MTIPRILSIAGADSSGGAGIQADIKTATALGAYAMTAITAVTAQDTTGVRAVQLMPARFVAAQIETSLGDIGADAIKIGMLGSGEIASAVAESLQGVAKSIPVVIDPVLASTSGTPLLDEAGASALRALLLPLAELVTPNIPEAEALTGVACNDGASIRRAGEVVLACGAKAVLIKGGHGPSDVLVDTLVAADGVHEFSHRRMPSPHTHGTGCTLAAAIAVGLAQGRTLMDSVRQAEDFVQAAIAAAPGFGRGRGPLNHMHDKGSGA